MQAKFFLTNVFLSESLIHWSKNNFVAFIGAEIFAASGASTYFYWALYLKLVLPNMHEFSQFWMFCNLHGILDKINNEKYDFPMQIKSLYLALFANFGHQSMHQD